MNPSPRLVIRALSVRSFRNLQRIDFKPTLGLNVISGANGQGKTSLLEAIYLLATTKSFRTKHRRDVIREGDAQATVVGTLRDRDLDREQRAIVAAKQASFLLENKRQKRLLDYVVKTPIVAFSPGDLKLIAGPSAERRLLLDRVALFFEPLCLDHRKRYRRAASARQKILEQRGIANSSDLSSYESLLATYGTQLCKARKRASKRLINALVEVFEELAPAELSLKVAYQPGGVDDEAIFMENLERVRALDRRRGRMTFGPGRDELEILLEGRIARSHASQGQQRMLSICLKLAELSCLRQARSVEPILLLDDVQSELDEVRTGAIYRLLGATRNQVFVTTTEPKKLMTGARQRTDFCMREGKLEELS